MVNNVISKVKPEVEIARLKELFAHIDYEPVPGAIKANLAYQFSDSALDSIINSLLSGGLYFPECKLYQEVYMIVGTRVHKCNIVDVFVGERTTNNPEGVHYIAEDGNTQFPFFPEDLNKTVFYGKDAKDKALKILKDRVVCNNV